VAELLDTTPEKAMVSCEVCLREVPFDQSSVVEVEDYVMYFCGLECYQAWRRAGKVAEVETK
jgi:hypothetical protein